MFSSTLVPEAQDFPLHPASGTQQTSYIRRSIYDRRRRGRQPAARQTTIRPCQGTDEHRTRPLASAHRQTSARHNGKSRRFITLGRLRRLSVLSRETSDTNTPYLRRMPQHGSFFIAYLACKEGPMKWSLPWMEGLGYAIFKSICGDETFSDTSRGLAV